MCNIFNSLRMKKKIEVEEQKMNLMQTLGIKTITLPKKKIMEKLQFSNIKDENKFRSNF